MDYQESSFLQRNKNKYTHVDKMSKESAEQILGFDREYSVVEESMLGSTVDMFGERYKEEIIPKNTLKERIGVTYTEARNNKVLSDMQKGKRADSAYKKLERQKNLMNEQKIFLERRKSDREFTEELMDEKAEKKMSDGLYEEEAKEMFRYWGLSHDEDMEQDELNSALYDSDKRSLNYNYNKMFLEMDKDTTDFSYSSDKQFVSQLEKKYDAISRYASLRYALRKFEEEPDMAEDVSLSRMQAKVEYFEALKEDYEDRMKLISSPYYTLLSKSDIKKGVPEDSDDDALKEYISLYQKLSQNRFGKGKNKITDFMKLYKEKAIAMAETDKERLNKDIDGLGIPFDKMDEKSEGFSDVQKEVLSNAYTTKKQQILNSYSKNDEKFLGETEPVIGKSLQEGLDKKSLIGYEQKMLEILQKGTICGKKIADKHMSDIMTYLQEYVKQRRQHISANTARKQISYLSQGKGFDVDNPYFKKTKEFKKLKKLMFDDYLNAMQDDVSKISGEYLNSMYNFFIKLSDLGYPISDKYGMPSKEKEEEVLKHIKTSRVNQHKDPDFSVITINGKQFTSYERSALSDSLKGKTFTVEGKKGEQLLKDMEKLSEFERTDSILSDMYLGEGGDKSLFYGVFQRKHADEMNELRKRIQDALK